MTSLTGLTSQANQDSFIVLPDGSRAKLSLHYRPQQLGWFFDLAWPGSQALPVPFNLSGARLVASPNILRGYRKLIPFGLMMYTIDQAEPMGLTCFVDGTADLILLTADEVAQIEATGFPGL